MSSPAIEQTHPKSTIDFEKHYRFQVSEAKRHRERIPTRDEIMKLIKDTFGHDHAISTAAAASSTSEASTAAAASSTSEAEPDEKAPQRKRKVIVESDEEDNEPLSKKFGASATVVAAKPTAAAAAAPAKAPVLAIVQAKPSVPTLADVLRFLKTCSKDERNQVIYAMNARDNSEYDEKTRTMMAAIKQGTRVSFLGHAVKGKKGHRYLMKGTVTNLARTNVEVQPDTAGKPWTIPAAECTIIG